MPETKKLTTFEEFDRYLRYEPETGKLFYKPRPRDLFNKEDRYLLWTRLHSGAEAFTSLNSRGYKRGKLFERTYEAHRLCWLLGTGRWPVHQIDHIDGDKANNRLSNLRDVPQLVNARNRARSRRNTSGTAGIRQTPNGKRWVAVIGSATHPNHLIGTFDSYDEALRARQLEAQRLGYTPRHGLPAKSETPSDV